VTASVSSYRWGGEMWLPLLGLLDRASVTDEVIYAGYISIAHPSRTPVPLPPEGGARYVH